MLTTRVMLPKGSQGARINLNDRWFNPVDTTAYQFSMYSVELHPGSSIENSFSPEEDTWYTLRFEWKGLRDPDSDKCRLYVNNSDQPVLLPLNRESMNGISYVHFISSAEAEDSHGLLVESVEAVVDQ